VAQWICGLWVPVSDQSTDRTLFADIADHVAREAETIMRRVSRREVRRDE
jgi:hypothetical protein